MNLAKLLRIVINLKRNLVYEQKNRNGIWFFGLAGSGKTFASKFCAELIENAFVIDGDVVRKFISYDLGYSSSDRIIQVDRVLGVAKIARINSQFPIASTVTMTDKTFQKCNQLSIEVVEITRPMSQIHQVREIYKENQNVVGKHIQQKNFNTKKLHNTGGEDFENTLRAFIK